MNLEDFSVSKILSNRSGRRSWRKKSLGFFGMTALERTSKVLVASRERFGTPSAGKKSTDTALFCIDDDGSIAGVKRIEKVHDVHQIATDEELLFLTETGLNRVQVFSVSDYTYQGLIEFGDIRKDINHINAVQKAPNGLLVGLNNRGTTDAEVCFIASDHFPADGQVVRFNDVGKTVQLSGLMHTHDLRYVNEGLWVCASEAGSVHEVIRRDKIGSLQGWVRGLAQIDENHVAVGSSPIGNRKARHSEKASGALYIVRLDDRRIINKVTIPGSGQICDLLYRGEALRRGVDADRIADWFDKGPNSREV